MQVNTQFDKGWRNAILFCIELIVKQAAIQIFMELRVDSHIRCF